jgi:hypothetical protein
MREFQEAARDGQTLRIETPAGATIQMPAILPDIIEPDPVVENGQTVELSGQARRDWLEKWWTSLSFSQKVTVHVFIWLFTTLFLEPILQREVVDRFLSARDEAARVVIITEVQQNFGRDLLEPIRCVKASHLRVRSAADKDAEVVDELSEGQSVEVVERSGGFSHIRYVSTSTGDFKEGWAATSRLVPLCSAPQSGGD